MRKLSIVVPCYNEQDVLPETGRRLLALLAELEAAGKIGPGSAIFFVDDGSRDATWATIEKLHAANPAARGVKLSRNCGHQHALLAGLLAADGDVAVSIDADLQHDIGAIEKMLDANAAGADVVFGVRRGRTAESALKRATGESFYRVMAALGVEIVRDHADYRLLSRRALDALARYEEVHLFLRGLVPRLGFRTATVAYDQHARFAGEAKYTFRKMLALAADGVTSFSITPLRLITVLGFAIALASFVFGTWALAVTMVGLAEAPGWASTVIPIFFLGGIQILALGVIGEYVGKTYMEAKRRPRFHVETML